MAFDWSGLLKRRVMQAGDNSLQGLKACYANEEAFRVEVVLAIILFFVAIWLANDLAQWGILVASILLVLIVELLNSAVEATVDRIGEEYHELAKRAKDIGSAAVLLSMLLFVVVWGAILISRLFYQAG